MKVLANRWAPALTQRSLGFALIAILSSWLYYPYLNNPLVFDDSNLFHTEILTTAAIAPWELGIRGLPYFTLGWVETQIGSIVAHRSVSLALHILVAHQMCRFLEDVLIAGIPSAPAERIVSQVSVRWIAVLVAAAFACHPVAVYGAGYLVQRTIVFATLFALLCLRSLLYALRQNDLRAALRAAIWASLSILSKQHAVVLPIAALALIPTVGRLSRETLRISAIFLILSTPAMLLAVLTNLSLVGQVYESSIRDLETELHSLPPLSSRYERWLLSASTQARLYFSYWQQWLFPDPDGMSADLRVDFFHPWTHAKAWVSIVGLVSLPCLTTFYSVRTHRANLLAFALTFTSLIFLVELSTVRFQEPYALYRSYLWSIGYCTLVAAFIYRVAPKVGLAALALTIPALMIQATGRLDTFRSKLALWDDAVTKLPKLEIAGASRILFNRGGERYRSGNIDGAMADINEAIRLNPGNGRFRMARATALLSTGRAQEALIDLESAKTSMSEDGQLLFLQSRTLGALGRTSEADAALVEAARHGSFSAKYELAKRRNPTGDITIELSPPH